MKIHQNDGYISPFNSKCVVPEICECGRLYKDRKDETGKMLCSACYTDCSVEDLKKIWTVEN